MESLLDWVEGVVGDDLTARSIGLLLYGVLDFEERGGLEEDVVGVESWFDCETVNLETTVVGGTTGPAIDVDDMEVGFGAIGRDAATFGSVEVQGSATGGGTFRWLRDAGWKAWRDHWS